MQRWLVKFALGCIGVDEEKVSHVLSCADPGAVQHCLSSFRGPLQQRLTSELTDPSLALAIVDVTTRARQGRRIHPSSYSPDIASAIRAQPDYYSSIGSKGSPRRWATAVIHQFFLTCWDLWTYRNQRLHGTGGLLEAEQHQSLNDSISSELAIGLAGALPQSHSLLQIPLQVLHGYTLTAKRQRLATIQLARRHFAAPLPSQQPYRQEAALMRAWLQGS
eukprot:jgi/Psemu1/61057/gm1.61057_g